MLRRASPVVVIAVLLGGLAAPLASARPGHVTLASARPTNVLEAIRTEDRIIHANPAYRSMKHFKISTLAQARAGIPRFQELSRLADRAASTVARASATPAQRAGQRDWVSGVHDVAQGVGDLAVALEDLVAHHPAAARTENAMANRLVAAGNAIGTRGDRLLHLPTSD